MAAQGHRRQHSIAALVLLCYKIDTPSAKLRAGNESVC